MDQTRTHPCKWGISCKDGIYVFGGKSGKSLVPEIEYFDSRVNKWNIIGLMKNPIYSFTSIISGTNKDDIYLLGGIDSSGKMSNQTFETNSKKIIPCEYDFTHNTPIVFN